MAPKKNSKCEHILVTVSVSLSSFDLHYSSFDSNVICVDLVVSDCKGQCFHGLMRLLARIAWHLSWYLLAQSLIAKFHNSWQFETCKKDDETKSNWLVGSIPSPVSKQQFPVSQAPGEESEAAKHVQILFDDHIISIDLRNSTDLHSANLFPPASGRLPA